MLKVAGGQRRRSCDCEECSRGIRYRRVVEVIWGACGAGRVDEVAEYRLGWHRAPEIALRAPRSHSSLGDREVGV
jgi:hypothetical protein